MRRSTAALLAVSVSGCFVMLSCQGQPNARYYDSPIGDTPRARRATLGTGDLLSNLGEYRGASGDGPTWFNHGATDFIAPRNTNVFSPDKGEVEFYGGGGPSNSGAPPVKIGRFAFLHFTNVQRLPVDPRTMGDPNARTFVVDPGDPIWVLRNNRPRQTTLRRQAWVEGIREEPSASGTWTKVFWFNRRAPIGQATGPDLHMIYYDDPRADYSDRASIRNALLVLRYANRAPPVVGRFRLFAQAPGNAAGNRKFLVDNAQNTNGEMSIPDDRGVDVVVRVSSFGQNQENRAGIYRLSYTVYRVVEPNEPFAGPVIVGPGGRRLGEVRAEATMFTYDGLAPRARDTQLVAYPPTRVPPDRPASLFGNANPAQPKYTSYVVSNTDGVDTNHWELEDAGRYPDGDYLVRTRAWSVQRSQGIGNPPLLNDAVLDVFVSIETDVPNQKRFLFVSMP